MSDKNDEPTKTEKKLRQALKQCRELLEKTEKLLERSRRSGAPKKRER